MSSTKHVPQEKTFTAYTTTQSTAYADNRLNYHPSVYNTILEHHAHTGGGFTTCLDVGCGPGLATRVLAENFANTIGLDPGAAMLSTARSIPSPQTISYVQASAEDMSGIASDSVDLLTVANAVHWFDMAGFWAEAARVVRAGGSVAVWTSGKVVVHPDMPNAAKIQAFWDGVEESELGPFIEPGNRLVRERYAGLVMPWDVEPAVQGFGKEGLRRWDWEAGKKFFGNEGEIDMDTFEKMVGTGSAVTRWRQANPDKVGTEEDVVRVIRRGIERLLWEAGVEKGTERVRGSVLGLILMLKKRG